MTPIRASLQRENAGTLHEIRFHRVDLVPKGGSGPQTVLPDTESGLSDGQEERPDSSVQTKNGARTDESDRRNAHPKEATG